MFQIGLFPTTFGIVLSVLGALLGGAFISRFGIFHAVWFLGLLQAVSNLGYSFVDWMDLGRFGLYGASMFESLSGGLGTAAFLAFLMNICQKEHATIQYAFLSSIFSLTGRLIGGISGLGAERLRLRQLLCDHFFVVDAGLSFAAVGEAVDSRRAAEMNQRLLVWPTSRSRLRHASSSRLGSDQIGQSFAMAFQAAVKFLVAFAFEQQLGEPLGVADREITGKALAQSPHQAGYPRGHDRHR